MTKVRKSIISILTSIIIVGSLTACWNNSSLKGASTDKTYSSKELNEIASVTKGFNEDNFDYTKENSKSYDKWLSYMTNDLKKQVEKTIPSRIQADKQNETVEKFEKLEIQSIKKQTKDKKTYAVVNFYVYENVTHSRDKTKNGKRVKIKGDVSLLKVGNDYKVDAFDYGNATVVK